MLATRKPGRATKHFLIGLANIEPVEGLFNMLGFEDVNLKCVQ